jgi:endonuclease/exonuclease/phosphatase family metal-dependent hydrolase
MQTEQKSHLQIFYREWGQNQEDIIDQLGDMMEEQSQHGKLLVAGDFNLNPSQQTNSTYGARTMTNRLIQRAERAGLSQISFEKKIQRKVVASELDWILTSQGTW